MVKKKVVRGRVDTPSAREQFAMNVYHELRKEGIPEATAHRAKVAAFENPSRFEKQLFALVAQVRDAKSRSKSVRARTKRVGVRPAVRARRRRAA